MLPLLESIAVRDGKVQNLQRHEERYNDAFREFYGKCPPSTLLDGAIMALPSKGLFKLRIAYSETKKNAELAPYFAKNIKSLKLVVTQQLDYHLKYSDRERINELFTLREDCDDVLIVNNGLVSDTSIGNIIFRKEGCWYTPDSPLLAGTMRAQLLDEGHISTKTITKADIKSYDAFQVVNALRPYNDDNSNSIVNIIF